MYIKSIKGNISGNLKKKGEAPEIKRIVSSGKYTVLHDGIARVTWAKYSSGKSTETNTARIKLNGVSMPYTETSGTSSSYCHFRRADFEVKAGDIIDITIVGDIGVAIINII